MPLPVCEPVCETGALFAACADESTSFDWWTLPPEPSLPIRIGLASFDAPLCVAELRAADAWCTSDVWPVNCTPDPADCVAVCDVGAAFEAAPCDAASFAWETEPAPPVLATAAGSAAFAGADCRVAEPASEPWSPVADWIAACAAEEPQPHDDGDAVCVAVCVTGAVFAAVAADEAEFVCDTFPSLPGLRTRIESVSFDGSTWVVDEPASAACVVSAACVDDWTPEPLPVWEPVWVVEPLFEAPASDAAVFVWVVLPLFPGLSTRTEMFELLGFVCCVAEVAPASCAVDASCCADWTSPDRQPQAAAAACAADCEVDAVFAAFALESASFDCVTAPSSPSLRMRTEMFWFDGAVCVALDPATAAWPVLDDWVADCTGSAASAVAAVAMNTASATTSVVISRFMSKFLLISLVSRAARAPFTTGCALPGRRGDVVDTAARRMPGAPAADGDARGGLEQEVEGRDGSGTGSAAARAPAGAAARRRRVGRPEHEREREAGSVFPRRLPRQPPLRRRRCRDRGDADRVGAPERARGQDRPARGCAP
jgi:hypothetical protein